MKRPGGAERRCGGAAPLFDAPHAPPSIMYGALLPALRSVIKLLLLLKAQIHRDARLQLVSLFFFLSFVSLLLFVPSVPHPLSFSLFSLSPHSFIHPLLLSHLLSSQLPSLPFFSSSSSLSLHFLTFFPHFLSFSLFCFLSTFPLFASSSPLSFFISSHSSSYLLPRFLLNSPVSSLFNLLFSHPIIIFCHHVFLLFFPSSSPTLPPCPPSPHALSSFPSYAVFTLSPLFSALFYRPHLVISYLLPQQSFCHPFSPASLFVFFPLVLPPVPLSFLSPSFPPSSLSLLSWLYECVLDLRALRWALLSPRRCSVFGMRR